jgi:hypothetical protein
MWKIFKHKEKVSELPIPTDKDKCIISCYFIGWQANEVRHNEMYGSQVTKTDLVKGTITGFDEDSNSVKIGEEWFPIGYNTIGYIYTYKIIKQ